jgi:hypothetical protein
MTTLTDQWLGRMKETLAVDVARFQTAGLPPRAIVEKLFDIPEVEQAFHLRANQRRPLALDPSTNAERQEIIDALTRVIEWLDDGFHEPLVLELRDIADVLAK